MTHENNSIKGGGKKINRVLLIFPPAYCFKSPRDINPIPPMGLGYLAANAKKHGYQVKIYDCLLEGWDHEEDSEKENIIRVGSSDEEISKTIREFKPDFVGVSCQFSRQHKIYPHIFSLIKSIDKNIITMGGGAHVTVLPELVLGNDHCDYILQGEAEESLVSFLKAKNNHSPLNFVDGLGWKNTDGSLVINPKTQWISDLDTLPFPDYDAMGLTKYYGLTASHGIRHEKEYSAVITSRGCPARCTFCSANKVWGWKYRSRSVENVLTEMRLLKEQYGVREIMFEDDNVTANRKFAAELFSRMIEEKFNFTWDTPNGVGIWTINEGIIDLMRASGCIRLNFPIESGEQRVLKEVIKKPLDLNHVKKLIRHCQKTGLDYGIFLVMGMPGETVKDVWTSFKYCADVGCYNPLISIATPYPGTELYKECIEKGYFSREFTLDDLFISSFMLKTPHWNEKTLRRAVFKGIVYLRLKQFINHPNTFLTFLGKVFRKPKTVIIYVKRILTETSI